MTHAQTDGQRDNGLRFMSWALRKCATGIVVGLLLLPASLMAQQAGDLDTSFGAAGQVLIDIGGDNDEGSAVALQPDCKIVMAGSSFNAAAGFVEFAVARYLPDGNLDTSFGGDGLVTTSFGDINAITHAVALQPDGKIIAAGYTIGDVTSASFALARYLPDGSLDTTFSGDGKLTMDTGGREVNAILLQPDGKVVAVGTTGLARFHPDGALDRTFGAAGFVNVDFMEQIAAARQPDGKIVTAGQIFNASTSQREFALARFLSNGTLDTTFHTDGRVNTDVGGSGFAWAVTLQPDGKIIAAGDVFSVANGHTDFALARYLPNGRLDTTFSGDGRVTTDFGSGSQAFAVTLQPDGKIVAAGLAFGVFGLARYLPNGTLDTTFSDDGLVTTSFGAGDSSRVRGLVMQPDDGRLVAAGSSTLTGEGGLDFALARYESGLVGPPTNKEQCKHGGWREFAIPRTFKNQGDCISFVNTGR